MPIIRIKGAVFFFAFFMTVSLHAADIFKAVENADLSSVKEIINTNRPALKSFNALGRTPLHEAASKGFLEIAEFLLNKGSDINARAKNGMTPLHLAAAGNHPEMVKLLLDNHADGNSGDNAGSGMKPLHYACILGNMDMIRMMIETYGMDVDTADINGTTILMNAARRSSLEVAKYLVKRGADLKKTDHFYGFGRLTALDYAYYAAAVLSNKSSTEMILFLRSAGAKTSKELDK